MQRGKCSLAERVIYIWSVATESRGPVQKETAKLKAFRRASICAWQYSVLKHLPAPGDVNGDACFGVAGGWCCFSGSLTSIVGTVGLDAPPLDLCGAEHKINNLHVSVIHVETYLTDLNSTILLSITVNKHLSQVRTYACRQV